MDYLADTNTVAPRRSRRASAFLLLAALIIASLCWLWLQLPTDFIAVDVNGEPVEGIWAVLAAGGGLLLGGLAIIASFILLAIVLTGVSLLLVLLLGCLAGGVLLLMLPVSLPLILMAVLVFWLVRRRR